MRKSQLFTIPPKHAALIDFTGAVSICTLGKNKTPRGYMRYE